MNIQSIGRLLTIDASVLILSHRSSWKRLNSNKILHAQHRWSTHISTTRATSNYPQNYTEQQHPTPTIDITTQSIVALGQVMAAQANFVRVRVDKLENSNSTPPQSRLLCVVRALLKKMKREVLVGDRVRVVGIDWADGRGMVEDVLPRDSQMSEPPVANVSHVLLVFSLSKPPMQPSSATRYLITAEAAGLPITIALNKADLLDDGEVQEIHQRISSWGYHVVLVSVVSGTGLDELESVLRGKTTVVAGPSGAGKSSIINAMKLRSIMSEVDQECIEQHVEAESNNSFSSSTVSATDCIIDSTTHHSIDTEQSEPSHSNDENTKTTTTPVGDDKTQLIINATLPPHTTQDLELQAVGEISERAGRGKHTTRNVTLVEMGQGGLLVDTPGFNQPNVAVPPHELAMYFPEIQSAVEQHGGCAFKDCRHLGEPGCVVGSEWDRYHMYSDIYAELIVLNEEMAKRAAAKRQREGTARVKSGAGGKTRVEARLESKTHRRVSRRSVKQKMSELAREVEEEDVA